MCLANVISSIVMMDQSKRRKFGALWAIGQGLLTAVAPRQSAKFMRKMIAKNFDNADQLEPKAGYIRQLRALGIGLTAAGIAGIAMEAAEERKTTASSTETKTTTVDVDEETA